MELALSFTSSSCMCTESTQPSAHPEVLRVADYFFVLDESVVTSSVVSASEPSMALVTWTACPLVAFGQSLIMWLLLAHSKQRPPSMRHCRSWGVSLPSLPSLSIKSGLFCAFSLGLLLSFEPDASLAGSDLRDLFPNFPLVQGVGPPSWVSLALRSQYL